MKGGGVLMDLEAGIIEHSRSNKEEIEEETISVLLATISGKTISFSQEGIKEVAKCDFVLPIPGVPYYVFGLVNIRGEFEALIDFRSLISIPTEPLKKTFEAILGISDEHKAAFYVDSVLELVDLPKSRLIPLPSDLKENFKSFLLGEIEYNGENVPLFSFPRIVSKIMEQTA